MRRGSSGIAHVGMKGNDADGMVRLVLLEVRGLLANGTCRHGWLLAGLPEGKIGPG